MNTNVPVGFQWQDHFFRLIRPLTSPHSDVTDGRLVRRLQALALFALENAIFVVVQLLTTSEASLLCCLLNLVFSLVLYLLTRSRWYKVALNLTVVLIFVAPFVTLLSGRIFMMRQLIVSFLIASIFIQKRFSLVWGYVLVTSSVLIISFQVVPLTTFATPSILLQFFIYFLIVVFLMTAVQHGDLAQLEEMAHQVAHDTSYQQALMASLPGMAYTLSPDYRVTQAHGAQSTVISEKVYQLVGERLPDHVPESYWKYVQPYIDQVLRTQQGTEYEIEIPRPGESGEWIENHLAPLIVNQEPVGVLTLMLDITDRKLAQQESEAHLRMLQTVLDAIRVGVFIQQDEQMVFHNEMVRALTGYTDEELRDLSLHDLIMPEMRALTLGWLQGNGRVMELTQSEVPMQDRYGKRLWVNLTLSNIVYYGEPAVVVAFVNATRNVEMQQTIVRRERRFRSLIEHSSDVIVLLNEELQLTYVSPAVERFLGYPQEDWLTEDMSQQIPDLIHPDDKRRLFVQLRQLVRQKEPISVRYRVKHANGNWVWLEIVGTNMLREPGVEAIIINAHDITTIQTALQSERKQRVLSEVLLNTASALNSTLKLQEVLTHILENLHQIVHYEKANIALVEEDGSTQVVSHRGYSSEHLASILEAPMPIDVSIVYRRMIHTGDVVYIDDTANSPDWVRIPGREETRSYLGAPIILDDDVIGFLNLESSQCCVFDENSQQRLRQFTNHAALAIRNARAYEQGRALAATKERQRIASELHDAVSQTLFSASVISETLPLLYENEPQDVLAGLNELSRLTKGALAEMRALLMELRPDSLTRTNLRTLLTHLIDGFRTRTDAVVNRQLDETQERLSPDVRLNLYRITQESLNNIIRHAQATEVWVTLRSDERGIHLIIRDNGRGFSPEDVTSERMGLRIMRERAQASDIELTLETNAETGTTVHAFYATTSVSDSAERQQMR